MIVFDLKCFRGHVFEAWFGSTSAYEDQKTHGEVECPVCGTNRVEKAVMAPNIGRKGNQDAARANDFGAPDDESVGYAKLPKNLQAELDGVLEKVRRHVEDNCDYVGTEFPEEARKIHYGEAPERGIYGEASVEESMELIEEGIEVFPLPGVKKPGKSDA